MSLYESQSHQEIARQRHAQVIRNATIRYAAKPSYEPKQPAPVEQRPSWRLAFASLFQRSVPAA
jgi:hypothetical protein